MNKTTTLKEAIKNTIDYYTRLSEDITKIADDTPEGEMKKAHTLSAKLYEGKAKGFAEALEFINAYIG